MNGNGKISAETQIQGALAALLEVSADKSLLVLDAVNTSLRKIAQQHPNEVLVSCCQFYEKNPKLSGESVAVILRPMEDICRDQIVLIDGDTLLVLIEFCLDVMKKPVPYDHQVQLLASAILVALGTKHCVQVMDGLLKQIEIGSVPHFTIPHTLGSLASANAFGVIPYLKKILSMMIPLLGGIKVDGTRQAFAYALDSFAVALVEYTGNLGQAPDPTIRLDDFQVEMPMIYEVLFSVWLNSREPKVLETVLHAMAAVFAVLSVEKIRQHTLRTVQVLVGFLKKQKTTHAASKCLCSVLSVAAKTDGTLLEPLTESLLHTLSDLVCVFPDYAQPELLRTHSEVLRCFECLAVHFTDHTFDHLIQQIRGSQEKERVKSLIVLTHLVNSSEASIKSRLGDVLAVLRVMLHEPSIKIKRALVKIIVAIAYKDFLGGKNLQDEKFMEFIVKLCIKQSSSKEFNKQELLDLQHTADNTLYMLTTSVPALESALWTLLLQCFLSPEYEEATVTLLRCLTHLASKGASSEPCEAAFVRCLLCLAKPIPDFRGTFALNFLRNIRPSAQEEFRPVWDAKIPQLLKYLEQNYDALNEKEWEDLLFDFVSFLLDAVKDEGFKETLIIRAKEQLMFHSGTRFEDKLNVTEKRFLLKFLAIVGCHLTNKQLVVHVLDIVLETARSPDMLELQSCAEAVGICSRTHLTIVLEKLAALRRDVLHKKAKFFGLIKDQKNDTAVEKVRYVVISSYAEVCNEAPSDDLLRTIQSEILDFVTDELKNCSQKKMDFIVRASCLKAIGAVADAMHPNRNKLHVHMLDRDKVLALVVSQLQLHNGPEYIELFPVVLPVLAALTRLPHALESETRMNLLKVCFDNVFNASAIYCKISSDSFGDLKLAQYIYSSFNKLYVLVQELLLQSLNPATLDEIVTLLERWLCLKKAEQRLPSLEALRVALQTYLDNMKFAYESPSTFNQTGLLLGKIVPRCTDPNTNIRKMAVECVCLVLCIASRYEGRMRDYDKILHNSLFNVLENIDTDEPKMLFNLTIDLAHVIGNNVPAFQVFMFVDSLLAGLLDVESASSNGASVVLNTVLKIKGGDLQPNVSDITKKMVGLLDDIKCQRTRSTTLRAIHSMSTHHLKTVVHVVLCQPLPYTQSVRDCWSVLCNDASLATDILEYLKKIMKSVPFYEEQQQSSEVLHIANLPPFQAVSAFCELFKCTPLSELCKQQFPELFSLLLIALASYIGTAAPVNGVSDKKEKFTFVPNREAYKLEPAKICKEAFKLFLYVGGNNSASNILLQFEAHTMDSFIEMMDPLADVVCAENGQSLAWLVAALGPYSRSDFDPQRIAVTAFFTALLRSSVNGQTVLAENILELLLDVHADTNCVIKKLCFRGLGHAAEHLNSEIVIRFSGNMLNALLQGLDYHNISNESEVALEAMTSFSKLLGIVDHKHLGSCQVTAAVRIRPLLEQENAKLRRASFRLLGDLAASVGTNEAFKEQVHGNLVALLLHLNDEDVDVIKACKYTLRKVGQFLDSPKMNAMIQEHLLEEGFLHFSHFITDLIKVMAQSMQDLFSQLITTCLSYFKSPWPQIRAHAALLVGLFFAQLDPDFKPQVSSDAVSHRLLQLLKDEDPEVRARAVEAIACLFVHA